MDTEDDRTYQRYFQNQQGKQQIETPSSTALAFHNKLKVVEGLIHGYLTQSKRGRDRQRETDYLMFICIKHKSLRTTIYSLGFETNILHLSILWFMIENKLLEFILQLSLNGNSTTSNTGSKVILPLCKTSHDTQGEV